MYVPCPLTEMMHAEHVKCAPVSPCAPACSTLAESTESDSHELQRIYLFAEFNAAQLQAIRKTMRALSLAEGQTLFDFGQPATRYFYVCSGQIKLFRNSPEGSEKVIEIIHAGETFAEAVMFMKQGRYPVSAQAITPTRVLAFDSKTMMDLLRGSIDTCFRMMAKMAMRLRHYLDDIDVLTLHSATFRLVSFLLQQVPKDVVESPEIQLDTPKHVIASRLSIQPETFSRTLAKLSKQGLIEVQGQNIVLQDVAGLRHIVEF
nr:Crp/Fnr family transcriptional regulator [Gammaproteobacteria bacterium]